MTFKRALWNEAMCVEVILDRRNYASKFGNVDITVNELLCKTLSLYSEELEHISM